MKHLFIASVLVAVCLTTGCSTGIKVTKVNDDKPKAGNPWNLGMTTFKVTITRQVIKCMPELEGKMDVMATPEIVLDRAQRYVLKSDGWWATSDIGSELSPSGISTALNAQSADATAAVLTNVVGTAANLALRGAAAGPGGSTKNRCKDDVAQKVDALYGATPLKDQVEAATATVEQTSAALLLAVQKSKYDKTLRPKVVASLQDQENARKALAKLEQTYVAALAGTTDVQTLRWPEHSTELHTAQALAPSHALYDKWVTSHLVSTDDFNKRFSVHLALSDSTTGNVWIKPTLSTDVDTKTGVPVRMAKTAQLMACFNGTCDEQETALANIKKAKERVSELEAKPATAKEIKDAKDYLALLQSQFRQNVAQVFSVLQLGQFYIVPVAGNNFRSQQAVIKMDANGLPSSIQVVEKSAAAQVLSGAALEVSEKLASLPAKLRAAELDKTNVQVNQSRADATLAGVGFANDTAAIQAQVARANAQNDLSTALSRTDNQGETASLLSQAELWNAKAELAQAQARGGQATATASMVAQTQFLNAQDSLRVALAGSAVSDRTSLLLAQTALVKAQAAHANALVARRTAEAEAAAP
ncbi:hypothetical protein [Janthinobacterium sp. 75]|uniref:hypothetical protein n=1 Tax=Janthinobacterium sp. 75 TaxID=2135628 RepID=UPI001063FF15|nr:hypothetical protein [Janthinobacterium sp. 75]